MNAIKEQARQILNSGKTGLKDINSGRSDIFRLNPYLIKEKAGWNSRVDSPENAEHIKMLAESIAEVGVKEPLTVYQDADKNIYVSDGHCRLQATFYAIQQLGAEIQSIPCKTEDRYSSEADRVFSQIVRNSGKPLAPIEQASVFKRLIDFGWTEDQIAKKAGLSKVYVIKLLELQAAPAEVQNFVSSGQVSATLTHEVLKTDGENAAETLQQAVTVAKEKGKTRATKKHVEAAKPKLEQPKAEKSQSVKVGKLEQVSQIIANAQIAGCTDGKFRITLDADEYGKLMELLKID